MFIPYSQWGTNNIVGFLFLRSDNDTHSHCLFYLDGILVCFITLHLLVHLSIAGFKMNFDIKPYTRQSWFGFLTLNLQQSALSFMLFWTLFYGLVYLY
jgi:hypothetical protein